MKRVVRTTACLAVGVAMLLSAPGALAQCVESSQAPVTAPNVPRYYGLWDVSSWGGEYIDKTAPFSNAVFVAAAGDDLTNLSLAAVKANTQIVVSLIGVPTFFGVPFSSDVTRPGVDVIAAYVDELCRRLPYQKCGKALAPGEASTGPVAAFFLPDEPYVVNAMYYGGKTATLPIVYGEYGDVFKSKGNHPGTSDNNPSIYERLDYVARLLHAKFPGVPVASNNAAAEVSPWPLGWTWDGHGHIGFGFDPEVWDTSTFPPQSHCPRRIEFPDSIDWVGFDAYLTLNGINWSAVEEKLDFLSRRKAAHQKLFLIPDAVNLGRAKTTEGAIVTRVQHYERYAANHPDVVGVFPYFYWTGVNYSCVKDGKSSKCPAFCWSFIAPNQCLRTPGSSDWVTAVESPDVGLRDLPVVRAEHEQWGRSIKAANPVQDPRRAVESVAPAVHSLLLR